jgi:predicted aconitase
MQLTDDEQKMLDGCDGTAVQKAMDLLMRYGEALGAERLVQTNNVCGTFVAAGPMIREFASKGNDAIFSEFNLDSSERVEMPPVKAYTCHLVMGIDSTHPEMNQGLQDTVRIQTEGEKFFGARGVNMLATCTPYQVGNVPVMGEHCAWMESSAVIYCNAVLGARTNTEGRESTGAASITGRIPYFGLHIPQNRLATHLIDVQVPVDDMMDWGLLGYAIGEMVEEDIPAFRGLSAQPNMIKLKHFGAAAASSGGVEMYHIPGVTPETRSEAFAFGGRAPRASFVYGEAERRVAYEKLNSTATSHDVDFIMLGCPHNSIEQVGLAARLLEGKRLSPNTSLWVFTPPALKEVADRSGHTQINQAAGGHVLTDTCPAISRIMPKDTKVVATDSAKQAHYLPAITGVQAWFGSVADCVEAAVSGRWNGRLG